MIDTLEIPKFLIFENSIEFIKNLNTKINVDEIIIDFKNLSRIDPFSLIYVSSEIQRFKANNKRISFSIRNHEHCTYQAHMGFFKAFGEDYGKSPGEALGSSTYIPIDIYKTKNIIEQAEELMVNPAEILENKAKDISNILTRQSSNQSLNEVI